MSGSKMAVVLHKREERVGGREGGRRHCPEVTIGTSVHILLSITESQGYPKLQGKLENVVFILGTYVLS